MQEAGVRIKKLVSENRKLARRLWGQHMDPHRLSCLCEISKRFRFSVAMNDLLLLDSTWYITHAGLIRLSERRHCAGIEVEPVS
jgi:hypothetical protein